MHALSAKEEAQSALAGAESATRFGEYKFASSLDKNDPRWLHAKEVCVCVCAPYTRTHTHTHRYIYIHHTYIHTCVCYKVDMVKVVLCRFIKSQLTGQSLINAFGEADEKKRKAWLSQNVPSVVTWTTSRHNKLPALNLRKADIRAARIIKALSKGLGDGGDGSDAKCTFAFVLQTVLKKKAATEWELEALLDHFHALIASKPMNECEVIAGRAYTGPLYVKMNGSLRKAK